MNANQEKLMNMGIDINTIVSRAMRGSVNDETHLMQIGIDIKTMLKSGVCPATFLAGGVNALPADRIKAIGVNKDQLSDGDLKKLGLDSGKLKAKGVDAKKLAKDGLEGVDKAEAKLGINVQILLFSVYHGLNQKRMLKAGVNLNTMLRAGIDPRLLLVGGLRGVHKHILLLNEYLMRSSFDRRGTERRFK